MSTTVAPVRLERPALARRGLPALLGDLTLAPFRALLWAGLWLAIGGGPWIFEHIARTTLDHVHLTRTAFPLVAGSLAVLFLLAHAARWGTVTPFPRTLRPWALYGVLALACCLSSPRPAHAAYWALCYLATLLVLWAYLQGPPGEPAERRARSLDLLTWAAALAMLVFLVVVAGPALLVARDGGPVSGYGVVNRAQGVIGLGMARASGFGRLAAIPALLGFVLALQGVGWRRLLGAALAVSCGALVVFMQSRGATLGMFGGAAVALLLMGSHARWLGGIALLVVCVLLVTNTVSDESTRSAAEYLNREGVGYRQDVTSGRTQDWTEAWTIVMRYPLWGHGPQADRYLLRVHVHNTYLYAALAAGVLGAVLILLGVLRAWRAALRVLRRSGRALADRLHDTQAAALLAFFTLRGIPEVSGAMFGVDLLVMAALMAWLDARAEGANASEATA